MQLPQHHKPSAHSCCPSWIRRSPPSPPPPPHKKLGGGRSRYACRLVPLLVLTVYSVVTVLRIPSASLVVSTADSGKPGARVPKPLLALSPGRSHGMLDWSRLLPSFAPCGRVR
jgi:hypothetical protein